MTEDVTRGLALLAEEAEPAPVDSHDVITRARALSRRRRSMATAFAAVVAIGAAAVTLQADHSTNAPAAQNDAHSQRLTAQLAAALPELIPDRWQAIPAPPGGKYGPSNIFSCAQETQGTVVESTPEDPKTVVEPPQDPEPDPGPASYIPECYAQSWYRDDKSDIQLNIEIGDHGMWSPCATPGSPDFAYPCREMTLPDGTQFWADLDEAEGAPERACQRSSALRPDGTQIRVSLCWSVDIDRPGPMKVEELAKFAEAFNY